MKYVFCTLITVSLLLTNITTVRADTDTNNCRLKLILDWFVNPDHASIVIAQQQNYFRQQNLNVQIIPPADPSLPPKLVAAKKAHIAVTYQPELHMMIDRNLPLKRFAVLIDSPLNSLIVLKDSKIESISQLRGKKIGYSISGFEQALLKSMLNKYSLSLRDVDLVNVNFALTPALISKQVDAIIGAYRNVELYELQVHGNQGVAFFVEDEGIPHYDELIFVAHKDTLDDIKQRACLTRFTVALEQAVQYLLQYPQQSWQLFIKNAPDRNNQAAKLSFFHTIRLFAQNPKYLDESKYEKFASFLYQHRLIEQISNTENYLFQLY